MKPLAQEHWPFKQSSPLLQSLSTLQPGWQNLLTQISPCRQFLSEWQSFKQTPLLHCSPLAQSVCSAQPGKQ